MVVKMTPWAGYGSKKTLGAGHGSENDPFFGLFLKIPVGQIRLILHWSSDFQKRAFFWQLLRRPILPYSPLVRRLSKTTLTLPKEVPQEASNLYPALSSFTEIKIPLS